MTPALSHPKKHFWLAWLILLLGVVACGFAAVLRPAAFFVAYLEAYLLVLGTALGSMLILLIHQLTGGQWGFRIQRLMNASLATLPWLLLFHVPLFFGMNTLYVWSRPDAHDLIPVLSRKDWYLNSTFFYLRTAFFWAVWLVTSFVLRREINHQIQQGSRETNRCLGSWALIVSVLTMSFAAVDWIMSLEPHFYSSIYGLVILVGFMISAFAWAIIVEIGFPEFFRSDKPSEAGDTLAHDLGNFLLMSVMLWAYGSFSQLLLVWSGQLPDEILFYHRRFHPPWQALGWALLTFGFTLPFVFLLWRNNKKQRLTLCIIAIIALLGHWMDLIWNVQPFFDEPWLSWTTLSLLASLTLGGIWAQLFKHSLQKVPHGSKAL
jgi:hypothetical protein